MKKNGCGDNSGCNEKYQTKGVCSGEFHVDDDWVKHDPSRCRRTTGGDCYCCQADEYMTEQRVC